MADDTLATAVAVLIDATGNDDGLGPTAVSDALGLLGLSGEAAAEVAEHVHRAQREHARLRRREHELSALFSSARELAELRDSEAVLARLVQRAREMMGVDVAYLSEFDPETSELRVRETSGSVSASLQALRVPPGRGLASAVVESRTAQWVSRYADYARERHDAGIDNAVSAEGLVSLLGVPMLSSDDVLGVLFVANREEKSFAPEEVALLSALADHASVILQTAQILRDLRESEDKNRRALERLTDHLAERDRANAVHQKLVQAVLAGGGFSPVAETLASALGCAVAIIDAREQVIAAARLPLAAGMLELDDAVRDAIAESRRSGHCISVEVDGIRAVSALTAGSQHFGALLLGDGELALGAVDRRTIERAAQVGALLGLQQEAASGADHRVRSELIGDLLDDVPERRADVERRARRLGVDLHALDSLLLLAVPGDQQTAAALALAPHLDDRALVGEYRGYVVAAFAAQRRSVDAERVREHVAHAIQHPVVVVVPPPAPDAIPEAFRLAMRTARLLAALGIEDVAATTDDFLPYSAVLDTDSRALAAFLRETIGAVRRYDAERNADLLGTLRAFVRNNASPTRTARALNFHTNTILQRLDRLDRVLGEDWRNDERLFRLSIAVRIDELREKLQQAMTER
ncbi:helix-turn-helix domain-containing protein [Saccharopolyspora phatthalungensis]|uniref:DNA-binding PucR family transcriptional regulator n=1 Tax=Saccharopolyspora phatthalungensis TaxID=664693 RepID=A0A840Q1W1_9PSEU|nr:GAF domain-containing protein [Saccharopolyspora phatthalungensis]MBB5153541.1 DNA-binding PucR family transcriptional regulator [Saccharopolyspora phatthalungensis]